MTPALALALIASFLTVPLAVLHSLLAWKFNKANGIVSQKAMLLTACTYILRVAIIVWLAASVAGLVVVSQQAPCLPDGANSTFWQVGVSCALYRALVIVSVLSFITVCIYFCSRELRDRPYDVSLLGVYKQGKTSSNGSILTNESWDSENTLKNDILYLCRRPDAAYDHRGLYWASSDETIVEKPADNLSIQHPTPIHPKPQLRLNTSPESEAPEAVSGISPTDSAVTDMYPISRTSTVLNPQIVNNPHVQIHHVAELPAPETPIPIKHSHKRAKSSVSSLRRFLPKAFPLSLPLSADPQIRALADPNVQPDVEKQADEANDPPTNNPSTASELPSVSQRSSAPAVTTPSRDQLPHPLESNLTRSTTMTFDDAPEVVPPGPLKVHKLNTTDITPKTPRSLHHPHNSFSYMPPVPPVPPLPTQPSPSAHPTRGPSYRNPPTEPDKVRRQNSRLYTGNNNPFNNRRQSQSHMYQFESSQIPRHTQSQGQGQYNSRQSFVSPQRSFSPFPRQNDVEIVYSSTRRQRPRSSTYGGFGSSISGHLDSIMESRASVDEAYPATENAGSLINGNTYRGANRTSMHGF